MQKQLRGGQWVLAEGVLCDNSCPGDILFGGLVLVIVKDGQTKILWPLHIRKWLKKGSAKDLDDCLFLNHNDFSEVSWQFQQYVVLLCTEQKQLRPS